MTDPSTVTRGLTRADEIRWTLTTTAHIEDVDVLTLNEPELVHHVADLHQQTRWLRRLLHEAVTCINRLTKQVLRLTERLGEATATILDLRRQLHQRGPI